MSGFELEDDIWPEAVPNYVKNINKDISGWKIGVPRNFIDSAPNEPEIINAFEIFLNLEDLGCKLEEIDLRGI